MKHDTQPKPLIYIGSEEITMLNDMVMNWKFSKKWTNTWNNTAYED